MDEVKGAGKGIVIVKNDSTVIKLVPIKKKLKSLFGCHQGQVITEGDIVSPLDVAWGTNTVILQDAHTLIRLDQGSQK